MKKANKRTLHPVEWVFYTLACLVATLGLTSLVFGIVGHHLTVPLDDNWIKGFEAKIVLDLRLWGMILIASAALIAVIVLAIFAQSADRKYEKSLRRQQRLSSASVSEMEIKPAVQEAEADSNPAK